ncbi:polyprenyl glycosylphosphotransferase [Fervidobacterium ngatamarikiense]|uniref:Polyprenyl glycosylphosphotransferase n=2 Tax=Fervidobacterium TaxID=2422 RepID=A0A172T5G9_FERPE|nr:polyprenyl glycosylphosphotransferase [Fervidobacterium pennivorans]
MTYITTNSILASLLFPIITVLALYAFRFYEHAEDINESLVRSVLGTTFASLFLLGVCKAFELSFSSRNLMISQFTLAFIVPFINYAIEKITAKTRKPIRYLVVGRKSEIYHILKEIEEKSKGKYQFADFINPTPVVFKEKVLQYDSVLIADPELEKEIEEELDNIKKTHKVEYLPNLAEKVLKRIPLEVMQKFEDYYKVYFSNVQESPAKRVMDIVLSIIGLVVYSPVILVSAIWIAIEDGRPIFFRQPRVGKDGKILTMVKLRSLKNEPIDVSNPNKNIEQRALKIGKIIRKTRIDESIQFWNILKGEMSLVGPRPEMIEYHKMMEPNIPYYSYRLLVKPGLTGWAQINYKHSSSLEEYKIKTEYDLYYVKNRNVFMDLKIFLLTLETLIFRKGAK